MPSNLNQKPFIVPVFIPHAGCPHQCIFCNQIQTTGQGISLPTPSETKAAISQFLSYRKASHHYTEIAFYGGNFLGLPPARIIKFIEIANSYIRQGRAHGIRFSTRPDTIDPDRLALINAYPITTVELGVQSMNDSVLMAARRGHTAQDTLAAVQMLNKTHWRLGLQMMVGLPGDTAQTALESGRQIAALHPDFVRIYPCLVLKGSPLARHFAQGRYTPLSLEQAVDQVAALYAIFAKAGISVIRMGLQPTSELNLHSGVMAGPFHPAFGELVHAALWRTAIENHLTGLDASPSHLEIQVHPRQISRLVGPNHMNIDQIKSQLGLTAIQTHMDASLPENSARINGQGITLY
jgi:histone acetyltransferase (RNA polymerase elongator complex component)